jgi:hypothetical protein
VVEGVDRTARFDLYQEARPGCNVPNEELDSVDLGAPEKEDFVRPTSSLSEFSNRRCHGFIGVLSSA